MPYPTYIRAYLQSLGGTSCGTLQQRLEWDDGAADPAYVKVSSGGDFSIATCSRIDLGSGGYTWELKLWKLSGTCGGLNAFRRSPAADNPVGAYCRYDATGMDCDAGEANVQDDDA